MPNPDKINEVNELKELLSSHNIQIITDHSGLSVTEISELRRELKEGGAVMRVAKNRLINIARAEADLIPIEETLTGPSSLVLAVDDPVNPAKTLKSFYDKTNKPKVKAILIDNKLLNLAKFEELASLPGLDELRAKVVSRLAAPLTGLVFTCSGLLRGLAVTLKAIADKRTAQAQG